MSDIFIADAGGRGRGVFAVRPFEKGELIERCEVILVPRVDVKTLEKTVLRAYYFAWSGNAAIALGNGSLYNHSYSPNAEYRKRFDTRHIEFLALSDILPGEEIFVNYNSEHGGKRNLWFDVKTS